MFQEGTKSKPNYEMNISTGPASNQDVLKVPETNKKKPENEIEERLSDVNKKLQSLIISDITNITDLSKFKEMLKKHTVPKTFDCTPPGITYKQTLKTSQTACKPHAISKEACDFVRDQYWHDENMKTCGFSRKVEICTITTTNMTHFQYKCSMNDCIKYNKKLVIIKTFSSKEEELEIRLSSKNIKEIQKLIPLAAKESTYEGFNFLFLQCANEEENIEPYETIGQLLLLPPTKLVSTKEKRTHKYSEDFNVNIVLLDSVSRSHFYRSLPHTIEKINYVNKNSDTEILDFELFQSIHGHTVENLHALFTGQLFPKQWSDAQLEKAALGIGEMFERFANSGYHTYYHDDLCYKEWCGLRMDLGSPATWDQFAKRLKANHIQNTGNAIVSLRQQRSNFCKISILLSYTIKKNYDYGGKV